MLTRCKTPNHSLWCEVRGIEVWHCGASTCSASCFQGFPKCHSGLGNCQFHVLVPIFFPFHCHVSCHEDRLNWRFATTPPACPYSESGRRTSGVYVTAISSCQQQTFCIDVPLVCHPSNLAIWLINLKRESCQLKMETVLSISRRLVLC